MDEAIGIPYEPGNHCVFYAVQAANVYFNNRGLTEAQRGKYKKRKKRKVELLRAITGKNRVMGGGIISPLSMVLSELKKHNIVASQIMCPVDYAEVFDNINFVHTLFNICFSLAHSFNYVLSSPYRAS